MDHIEIESTINCSYVNISLFTLDFCLLLFKRFFAALYKQFENSLFLKFNHFYMLKICVFSFLYLFFKHFSYMCEVCSDMYVFFYFLKLLVNFE